MPLSSQSDILSPDNEALLRAISGGISEPNEANVQMAQLFGPPQPQQRPQLSPAERDAIARRRAAAAEAQAAKDRAAAAAAETGRIKAGSEAERKAQELATAKANEPTVTAHPLAYRIGEGAVDLATALMPLAWRRGAQAGLPAINRNVASKISEIEALKSAGKFDEARKLLGGVKVSAKSAGELSNAGVPWYGYPTMAGEAAFVPPIASALPYAFDYGRPGEAGDVAKKRLSSDEAVPAAEYSAAGGLGALGAGLMGDKAIQAMPFSAPGKQRANQAAIDMLVRALKKNR